MLFSSTVFLCLFLPAVIGLYFLSPVKCKNYILLIASLIFYAFGEPIYVLILISVTLCVWISSLIINKYENKKSVCLGTLILSLVVVLSILFYFKYLGFAGTILISGGFLDKPFMETVMPLGISFYTFQSISYLVDVYTKTVSAEKNLARLMLYISFFPQLVAGPILKYRDIAPQLSVRTHTLNDVAAGLRRFIVGLGKKVLIANTLGEVADEIFALPENELSVAVTIGGAAFYMMQLYYDFSGYSDMAIGLGRLFGFKFQENFNYPYIASSLTDFWRRWHMSLSGWFKEYVYIPLGGNRKEFKRTLMNLSLVFLLTGLWHGANWTFIVWGLFHGTGILCEKIFKKVDDSAFPKFFTPFKHIYLLTTVLIGWVIFRSDSLDGARTYLSVMFGLKQTDPDYGLWYYLSEFQVFIFVISVLGASGLLKKIFFYEFFEQTPNQSIRMHVFNLKKIGGLFLINTYCVCVLMLSLIFLIADTFNPFIYFRF